MATSAAHLHLITIDGDFSDWAEAPSYFDPVGGSGVLHHGTPDTHDTYHAGTNDVPTHWGGHPIVRVVLSA